jgi:ribosomal RNA-processing protein 7
MVQFESQEEEVYCKTIFLLSLGSKASHFVQAFRTRLQLEQTEDDDGFMLVSKKKRARQGEGNTGSRRRKKKTKELDDFYRFQMRERKRNRTLQFVVRWEYLL